MGDWAHRFGASPLMRMTASWSWSAWTDRIQVRGAMLRPWAGSPQIVVADPTRCALSWRSDRTKLLASRCNPCRVRFKVARHLAADPNIPLAQVSAALDFSEPAGFTRTFQRWPGVSPRLLRS